MAQASLSFDPVTVTVSQGDIVPVDVLMYTGDDPVLSSDIWISYDPEVLSPPSLSNPEVEKDEFFSNVDAKHISAGKLYLYAIQPQQQSSTPVNGKVATVYFRAEKSGETQLRFDCVPFAQKTSQIIRNDTELTNIISCQATRTHTATVEVQGSNNVLGAQTSRTPWSYSSLLIVGILLAAFAGLLLYRYKRLAHELTSTE